MSDGHSSGTLQGAENAGNRLRRVVVKVGTNLVTAGGSVVDEGFIGDLARQVAHLRA
ncbi:MAG: hypothetical protein HQ548_00025, partial [Chloroflexi bacterium]|nr:hypothetical protein [Chloroflexota bacterium]